MKALVIFLVVSCALFSVDDLAAQSAVYVYKNPTIGEAEYLCMRGMPNQREAEMLAQQKLEEMVNDDKMVNKYASTNDKGYGLIIRSSVNVNGKKMYVFGAGLGSKSYKDAEKKALENLKTYNPEWKGAGYTVVHQFKDE